MPAGRDLSTGAAAGVRKPPRKEPAGAGWAGCRLWGFGWGAAWVGAAPAGVVCVGPTMAVAVWSVRRRAAGGGWRDRRRCRGGRARRGDRDATAGARGRRAGGGEWGDEGLRGVMGSRT